MNLFHYTSIESLALILKNRTIRFNRLDCVDDLEESMYGSGPNNIKLGQYQFVSCWTKDSEENLALWKMYTNNKGIRICLDSDMFITYPVLNSNSMSYFKELIAFGEDYMLTPIMNIAQLYDVQYVPDVKEIIKSLMDEKGNIITKDVGLYKNRQWLFQKESRFKIVVSPINRSLCNCQENVYSLTSTVFPSIEIGKPITRRYMDLPLKAGALDKIEVMMGPETNEADKYIVEKLIYEFKGATIKDSYFKGKIKSK